MLLHGVAQSLKQVKLLATSKQTKQLQTLLSQQCLELLRPFARSFKAIIPTRLLCQMYANQGSIS